ncbi:hypothetical protein VTK26DRAFT_1197 [Humicola hyalothermophila]
MSVDGAEEGTVRELFRHDCNFCTSRWSKWANLEEEASALEDEQSPRHPLFAVPCGPLERSGRTNSFSVNCTHMRSLLSEALTGYEDQDFELGGWTFTKPYSAVGPPLGADPGRAAGAQRFGPRRGQGPGGEPAGRLPEAAGDPPARETEKDPRGQKQSTTTRSGQIFPPGELVTTKFWGVDTLSRVDVWCTDDDSVILEYVDWNRKRCGLATTGITLRSLSGYRRVTWLPVYPVSYLDDPDGFKERMMERGCRFQQLRGFHYLYYSGTKLSLGENSQD